MTTWFTSDTHFGHARIIELCNRPFANVDFMREMIVNNWNAIVSPSDRVFHLGDVALGPIHDSLQVIKRLNGRKTLIIGNHDRNFRGFGRSHGLEPDEWDQVYVDAGFDEVWQSMVLVNYANLPPVVNLSHFPYEGDSHGDERHASYRFQDQGIPLVHGHTHSTGDPITYTSHTRQVPDPEDETGKGKITVPDPTVQLHVGMDAWNFMPVSDVDVRKQIEAAQRYVQERSFVVQ